MRATLAGAPVVVLAPATSANLGSGFDTAGLALDWWDTLKVTRGSGSPGDVAVHTKGEDADTDPSGPRQPADRGDVALLRGSRRDAARAQPRA